MSTAMEGTSGTETLDRKRYTLGLGQLENKPRKRMDSSEEEERLLIDRERERDAERLELVAKKSLPLHKKFGTYKLDREGVIQRIHERAIDIAPEPVSFRNARLLVEQTVPSSLRSSKSVDPRGRALAVRSMAREELERLTGRETPEEEEPKQLRGSWKGTLSSRQLRIMGGGQKETARQSVELRREVLRKELAILAKEKEVAKMREYMDRKESLLLLNKEIFDQDKKMLQDYVQHMHDKAERRKAEANAHARTRQGLEAEFDTLKQQRNLLRKRHAEAVEECRVLTTYKKFIFSLVPGLKEGLLERRNKRRAAFFLTQQKDKEQEEHDKAAVRDIVTNKERMSKVARAAVAEAEAKARAEAEADAEYKELKEELELSEHDSDTETPTGFSSLEEMKQLLKQKETKNLSLIDEAEKRAHSLERMSKNYETAYGEQNHTLSRIQQELAELTEEEKRKATRLADLRDWAKEEELADSGTAAGLAENNRLKAARRKVKRLVHKINVLTGTRPGEEPPKVPHDRATESRQMLEVLEAITRHTQELKMAQQTKHLLAQHQGKAEVARLQAFEKNVEEEWRKGLIDKAQKRELRLEERRKEQLLKRKKVVRTIKAGRELVRRQVLGHRSQSQVIEHQQSVIQHQEGIYFIDYP